MGTIFILLLLERRVVRAEGSRSGNGEYCISTGNGDLRPMAGGATSARRIARQRRANQPRLVGKKRPFDATADGQRFLMMLPSLSREPVRLTVTSNWQAGVRAIP
jgi:hypothetical protein